MIDKTAGGHGAGHAHPTQPRLTIVEGLCQYLFVFELLSGRLIFPL